MCTYPGLPGIWCPRLCIVRWTADRPPGPLRPSERPRHRQLPDFTLPIHGEGPRKAEKSLTMTSISSSIRECPRASNIHDAISPCEIRTTIEETRHKNECFSLQPSPRFRLHDQRNIRGLSILWWSPWMRHNDFPLSRLAFWWTYRLSMRINGLRGGRGPADVIGGPSGGGRPPDAEEFSPPRRRAGPRRPPGPGRCRSSRRGVRPSQPGRC